MPLAAPPRPHLSCKRVFNFLYPFLQGVAGTPGKNGFPVYYFLFSFHTHIPSHFSLSLSLSLSFFAYISVYPSVCCLSCPHAFFSFSPSFFLSLSVSFSLSSYLTPRLSSHWVSNI